MKEMNFSVKKMDVKNYENWLESYGLKLNAQSGGCLINDQESASIEKNSLNMYNLKRNKDEEILFFDGKLFWNTIKSVEKKVSYKLFT